MIFGSSALGQILATTFATTGVLFGRSRRVHNSGDCHKSTVTLKRRDIPALTYTSLPNPHQWLQSLLLRHAKMDFNNPSSHV